MRNLSLSNIDPIEEDTALLHLVESFEKVQQ
jgi:hypothetical protein